MRAFSNRRDAERSSVEKQHSVSKIKAFFEEFAFLRPLVKEEKVTEVQVSRITPDILRISRRYRDYGVMFTSDIYILDQSGALLTKVRSGWFLLIGWVWQENIEEAIRRLGDRARHISYIVISEHMGSLTVYKTPKGTTLPELIRKDVAEARTGISMDI